LDQAGEGVDDSIGGEKLHVVQVLLVLYAKFAKTCMAPSNLHGAPATKLPAILQLHDDVIS
jgi:hypothetical protein